MIYTIGHKKSYEQYYQEQGETWEKGIDGSVWDTREAAEAAAKETTRISRRIYAVYGVKADWKKDTQQKYQGVTWRSLVKPARLVKLT